MTALRVLETVAQQQPVGVSEIARRTETPKSSVQRCLITLHEAGWLAPTGSSRNEWKLTGRALAVGMHASAELGLREAALPTMQELRDTTHETIHLCSYSAEDGLTIIDRVDSDEPVRTWVRLGAKAPLHASASGKAVLAGLPETEAENLLAGTLERFSGTTLTERTAVLEELRAVSERGYATNESAWRPGVGAVAAALLDTRRRPVGALAISVPSQRYDAPRARQLGPLVGGAAREVSTALGLS